MHRAEQIVERIAELLQASVHPSIAAQNVYIHRTLSLADNQGEMPATTVNVGDDDATSELGNDNLAFIDSLLTVPIVTYAINPDERICRQALLNQRRLIHMALLADQSLGLPFVIGTRYGGAAAPELDSSAEMHAGSLETRWHVHYRMNITDPGD